MGEFMAKCHKGGTIAVEPSVGILDDSKRNTKIVLGFTIDDPNFDTIRWIDRDGIELRFCFSAG